MSHESTPFTPRPEARPMRWGDLLTPVQDAVADLLQRLAAAPKLLDASVPQHSATCLLVDGERGTGKTTVCMSTRYATENPTEFFGVDARELRRQIEERRLPITSRSYRPAEAALACHGRLCWLDALDLEPLPRTANLLATVLVRVRRALDRGKGEDRRASLLDVGQGRCLDDIDRLVQDAPLVWEDVAETDARDRARKKTRAAEIYADFPQNFRETMRGVSARLAPTSSGRGADAGAVLVLPIDNMDRSTEHVHAIFKLAQMISCPELWLIVAGDRIDTDVFLERAYWSELASDVGGTPWIKKPGADGEDESLVIARRQAAATTRKALPPAHRIRVDPVDANEALGFQVEGLSLRELLRDTPLDTQNEGPRPQPTRLLDLIDVAERLSPDAPETPVLTYAGREALRLPARALLDLWQRASRLRGSKYAAARIARMMLRNTLAESDVPDRLYKPIQERMILARSGGATVLDFSAVQLRPIATRREIYRIEVPAGELAGRMHVELLDITDLGARVELVKKRGEGRTKADLPGNAFGWLSLLLDVLSVSDEPSVVNLDLDANARNPGLMQTDLHAALEGAGIEHEITSQPLQWPTPEFDTTVDYNLFALQWARFVDLLKPIVASTSDEEHAALTLRLLVAAWVDNVCSVSGIDRGKWAPASVVERCRAKVPRLVGAAQLDAYEREVAKRAEALYDTAFALRQRSLEHPWAAAICAWLEEGLPLMATPEIMGTTATRALQASIWASGSRLSAWWASHGEYLRTLRAVRANGRAELEALDTIFPAHPLSLAKGKVTRRPRARRPATPTSDPISTVRETPPPRSKKAPSRPKG